jgi:DNA-binding response OmpR family regulator
MAGRVVQKKTILLIEDDTFLVKMYKSKFENEGFIALVAIDGEEGLKLALSEKIDMLVLDLMLPKLSGHDLLLRLREDEKGRDMPVIVLTNLSKEDESKGLYELGVKEYLVKADLTPTQLVEKIRTYL